MTTTTRYQLPPISPGMKGDINLFGWMATVNFTDQIEEVRDDDESYHDANRHDFSVHLTHEALHFIQALSCGYVFRMAVLLWDEIQRVSKHLKSLSDDAIINIPLQVENNIGDLFAGMHVKSQELTTPEIKGISAIDVMEGAVVYIAERMTTVKMTNDYFVHLLETKYTKENYRVYSDCYRLAEWYLGEDIFDLFSTVCFAALCSNDPGKMFCLCIRALGRSGVLLEQKRLSARDILGIAETMAGEELRSAFQENDIIGSHPILTAYLQMIVKETEFDFMEFAARPYEHEDIQTFRKLYPPLIRFQGGTARVSPSLPDLFDMDPNLPYEQRRRDNANLVVSIVAIAGAVIAMLFPDQYHMQCIHTDCPYFKLRLCHAFAPVPPRYQDCGFPVRFETLARHSIDKVQKGQ